MLDLKEVNNNWTLFLDRDGVINYEKKDDYILNPNEFHFYEEVPESVKIFSEIFMMNIIATNQRGVGKGWMTEKDLEAIHEYMQQALEQAGGRIDRIYYCTSLNDDDPFRKPKPGMALQAKMDFPKIDFSKAIMIGNNISDMEFGRNAGMHTVFLTTTHPDIQLPHPVIDLVFSNLSAFAKALQQK